jgi:hypothetical protein
MTTGWRQDRLPDTCDVLYKDAVTLSDTLPLKDELARLKAEKGHP